MQNKTKESKALTVLKTFVSLLLMILLLLSTAGLESGIMLRKTFSEESVDIIVDGINFSQMQVGQWLGQDQDYTLAQYVYAFMGNSFLEEKDIADMLDSTAFKDYAAAKIQDYISYIYSRKDDASVTTDELMELCEEPLQQAAEEKGGTLTDTIRNRFREALEKIGVEEYSASSIAHKAPGMVGFLHFATSYIMMVMLGAIGILLLLILILLNKRYIYKIFLYLGIPCFLEGISGVMLRLLSYPMEAKVTAVTGIPDAIINGIFEQATEMILLPAVILLGTGAAFLVLYTIIRKIMRRVAKRRQEKQQKAQAEQKAAAEQSADTEAEQKAAAEQSADTEAEQKADTEAEQKAQAEQKADTEAEQKAQAELAGETAEGDLQETDHGE